MKQYNIAVIGDGCIDHYHYGTTNRISPEAPIPIFDETSDRQTHGMAYNVANNLKQLGNSVTLFSAISSIKHRYVDNRTKQHLFRSDIKMPSERYEHADLSSFDAIVISDYNKGFLSYDQIRDIIDSVHVPVFIDTKKQDLQYFNGAIVKINEVEWANRLSSCTHTIVTLGGAGARYNKQLYKTKHFKAVDVCGAGDTFLAALVYDYLRNNSISSAITFANKAAGVSVQHSGTYAPTREEICGF